MPRSGEPHLEAIPCFNSRFPLRNGFIPRRNRALPPTLVQNVKTPLEAFGSGFCGNFLLPGTGAWNRSFGSAQSPKKETKREKHWCVVGTLT
jgi:hypothetical protein